MRKAICRLAVPPSGWWEIDYSHPLAVGLVGLFIPAIGGGNRNLVTGTAMTNVAGTFSSGPRGCLVASAQGTVAETSDLNFTVGPFTVAALFEVSGFTEANQTNLFSRTNYVSETNNQGWLLGGGGAGQLNWRFIIFNNNNHENYNECSFATRSNGTHFVLGRVDASYRNIWVDGVIGTYTAKNLTTPGQSVAGAVLGYPGAIEQSPVYVAYAWNRYLQNQEIQWLYHEGPLPFIRKLNWRVVTGTGLAASSRHYGFWGRGASQSNTGGADIGIFGR